MMVLQSLLLAAALQAAPAPDLQQRVSYTSRGADLSVVLAELETKTKVPMRLSQGVPPLQLVISVKEAPLQTLIDKIAQATLTDAGLSDGKMYFNRSEKKLAALREKQRQARIAALAKWRKEEVESLKKVPLTPEAIGDLRREMEQPENEGMPRRDYQSLYGRMPMRAIVAEVMLALTDEELATTNDFSRMVFSTRPTAMQRPLNLAAVNRALRKYAEGLVAWGSLDYGADANDPETLKMIREMEFRYRNATAASAHLVVNVNDRYGSGINVELRVFDAQGDAIELPLQGVSIQDNMEQVFNTGLKEGEKPLALNPGDVEFSKFIVKRLGGEGDGADEPMPAAIRDRLLNPERVDPLSFSAADILMADWERRKVNGVAVPTDYLALIPLYFVGSQEQVGYSSALEFVRMAMGIEVDNSAAGWSVLAPSSTKALEMARTRSDLGKFLRAVSERPSEMVQLFDEMVSSTGDFDIYEDVTMVMAMIVAGQRDMFDMQRNDSLGKVYRQLSAQQQSTLLRGGVVPTNSFNQTALRLLAKIAYGENSSYIWLSQVQKQLEGLPPEERAQMLRQMDEQLYSAYGGNNRSHILSEPTQGLPNGVGGGEMTGRTHAVPMIRLYDGKKMLMSQNLEGFGQSLYYYIRPATKDNPEAGPFYGKKLTYKLVNNLQVRLRVSYGADRAIFGIAKGRLVGDEAAPVEFSGLPAEVRQQLEKEMKEAESGEGPGPAPGVAVEPRH